MVADTEEEAKELAGAHKLIRIQLASGKKLTVGTREQAEEFARQSNEAYTIEELEPEITKGTKTLYVNSCWHFQRHPVLRSSS